LYNSIYRSDDQILVNQHTYGIPAAYSPAFNLHKTDDGDMISGYLTSLERVWSGAIHLQ
jgi:hypothetical protein